MDEQSKSIEVTHEEPLRPIEGHQLSAVTFVQDYVQLHFDGPVITAYTSPIVVNEAGHSFAWDDLGYRDSLCDLIAKNVGRAYVRKNDHLRIDFDGGAHLTISLGADDRGTQEAVMFDDRGADAKDWAVW